MKTLSSRAKISGLTLIILTIMILVIGFNHAAAQGITFTTNTYTTGNSPMCVVATDANGDGRLDLFSANGSDNAVRVLTNNGVGGFIFSSQRAVGHSPASIVAADINGDNKVDLICANSSDNSLLVLTNNGSGIFGSNATLKVQNISMYTPCVATADVNGDGKPDLICVNNNIQGGSPTLTVFTNSGVGVFGSNATLTVGNQPKFVAAADVNGDGYVDLISANYSANSLTVLTNNGLGIFGSNATLNVGSGPYCVAVASIRNDGKVDLISANAGNTLTVLTNNGSGVFGSNATLVVGNSPSFVVAADMNGDGYADLIIAGLSAGAPLTVLTNNGNGIFGFNTTLAIGVFVGGGSRCVMTADLNSDGKMDLVAANSGGNTLTVFLNTAPFPLPNTTPSLLLNMRSNSMNVTWPSASGWSLQENSDLTKTNWMPSGYRGYSIVDDGTNKSLSFQNFGGNGFFRLIHP